MKKSTAKYGCYVALTTAAFITVFVSSACSGPEMPKMTVSYGPEIGFADGNVNLSGTEPIINISDIKAEVGMNIDYLSGVIVENEEDFADLEIRVDASMVDIFTPGNYTVEYTFLFNDNLITKEITVSLFESEKSPSEVASSTTSKNTNGNAEHKETSTTHVGDAPSDITSNNTGTTKPTATTNGNSGTTKPTATTSDNLSTTKPTATTNGNSGTTKPTATTNGNSGTTKPTATTNGNLSTTKPTATTNGNSSTTKPTATTNGNSSTTKPDETSTTREIITTTGDLTTELKNIGNYTIELLSGKTITIKNTTKRYIVSTRTDVEIVEENGYTYRISKLIITYNTGFGQVLETIKDRIK